MLKTLLLLVARVCYLAPLLRICWLCFTYQNCSSWLFQENVLSSVISVELHLPKRGTCSDMASYILERNLLNATCAATPAKGETPCPDTSAHIQVSIPVLVTFYNIIKYGGLHDISISNIFHVVHTMRLYMYAYIFLRVINT